jgi:3-dehydroshikimate dehydratase
MAISGLCSITFRALTVDEVITAASCAGLAAIEWGGDGHVPPGDVELAGAVARRCDDAGLAVVSYGSYLLAGGVDLAPIDAVLDSAEALGVETVRVWTPFGVTPDSETGARVAVADALREICARAAARALVIGLEFHPGTITHTAASTNALFDEVGTPNLWTYWQPESGPVDDARCLAELGAVLPRLAHLHAFSWGARGIGERLPLAARAEMWQAALTMAAGATAWPTERVAYLEYVADDSVESLRRDAAVLNAWLGGA